MNIAKLRNTTFNKCEFNNLKFNKLPQPEKDLSEGYDFQLTEISFPMMGDDPYNAYSSIKIGQTKPIKSMFAAYDKTLHYKHREIVKNIKYNQGHVYKSYWSHDEIYCVTFNSVVMKSNVFTQINFISVNCNKTVFTDCIFINMRFTQGILKNSEFMNCSFSKCEFDNINFIDTIFTKCVFIRPYFRNSNLYVTFNECILDDCIFQSSLLPIDKYNLFNECKMEKYDVSMCSHHNGRILFDNDLKNHMNE